MSDKNKTISTRYADWIKAEPLWAYLCLFCFGLVFLGLMTHLGFIRGFPRQAGLIVLIIGDIGAIGISAWRKIYWWTSFYIFITIGVLGWEIASYFLG